MRPLRQMETTPKRFLGFLQVASYVMTPRERSFRMLAPLSFPSPTPSTDFAPLSEFVAFVTKGASPTKARSSRDIPHGARATDGVQACPTRPDVGYRQRQAKFPLIDSLQ